MLDFVSLLGKKKLTTHFDSIKKYSSSSQFTVEKLVMHKRLLPKKFDFAKVRKS